MYLIKSLLEKRVQRDTRNLVEKKEDHFLKLNIYKRPIAKSTVKENWKEPWERSEREPQI